MLPENMPYYRGPRVQLPGSHTPTGCDQASAEVRYVNALLSDMTLDRQPFVTSTLSIRPIQFGESDTVVPATTNTTATRYNAEFAAYALQTAGFSWAVYNFSNPPSAFPLS